MMSNVYITSRGPTVKDNTPGTRYLSLLCEVRTEVRHLVTIKADYTKQVNSLMWSGSWSAEDDQAILDFLYDTCSHGMALRTLTVTDKYGIRFLISLLQDEDLTSKLNASLLITTPTVKRTVNNESIRQLTLSEYSDEVELTLTLTV
jgi:hypothetical protein